MRIEVRVNNEFECNHSGSIYHDAEQVVKDILKRARKQDLEEAIAHTSVDYFSPLRQISVAIQQGGMSKIPGPWRELRSVQFIIQRNCDGLIDGFMVIYHAGDGILTFSDSVSIETSKFRAVSRRQERRKGKMNNLKDIPKDSFYINCRTYN